MNASNSPLAIYMDVDFETTEINQVLVPEYMNKLNNNEISEEEINRYIAERNNIISEFRIVLKVIK